MRETIGSLRIYGLWEYGTKADGRTVQLPSRDLRPECGIAHGDLPMGEGLFDSSQIVINFTFATTCPSLYFSHDLLLIQADNAILG